MIDGRTEEKEVEVIAEKSRKNAYVFLALAVSGAVIVAVGAFLLIYIKTENSLVWELCVLGVGAVLLLTFAGLYISRLFRPYALITFEDGVLKFNDGATCNPGEITTVEKGKDKIILTVNGEKKEICGEANIDKAYRKLCVLTGNPALE